LVKIGKQKGSIGVVHRLRFSGGNSFSAKQNSRRIFPAAGDVHRLKLPVEN